MPTKHRFSFEKCDVQENGPMKEESYDWNDTEYYGQFIDQNEASLIAILYLSYMPLCCFVGLTGNCMVLILIRSNRIFRKLPSSAYLLTLAVMSSLFLVSLLSFWIDEGFGLDHHSTILCKCSSFLAHFCDFASVWLIVLVGFERLTLLYKASSFRVRRTLTNSQRQVIVLLIIVFLCNCWILFVAEMNPRGGCDIGPEYTEVYNLFSAFETISCMIIPSIFIVVSNILVVLKLRAHLKQIPSSPTVSFNTADTVYSSGPSQTIKSTKISKASLCRLGSRFSLTRNEMQEVARCKRHSLRYADLQLTRSLLVVTTVFILLNIPNYAYRTAIQFLNISEQSETMQRLSFAVHILLYTHHAILFYLYIFYSPQMKKRLVPTALKLLECYCLKHVHEDSAIHGN
uniref:G-protein coupled receptors family 1 profile domain-containing protein n=1 Tax=Panagrolaimus sp. JU765 TaxID=591449 RepID=A0AC34Q280_9BILA